MNPFPLRVLFRNVTPFSLQKLCRFCSSSWPKNNFSGESEGGSAVYNHALKFQRPTTLTRKKQFYNSVSLIGSVDLPLKKHATKDGRLGVHTLLSVRTSCISKSSFRILVAMWDNMAAISIQHLKPNDFIYVSGRLESYTKTDLDGKLVTLYKVDVKKLNFVAQRCTPKQFEKSELEREEARLERYKNELHLWQVFFANPFEWWDKRKTKKGPEYPDFRHKDTDEALWINPNDPPWIKKQLELHDSRMAEREEARLERYKNELHLWQVFFANPFEWWDNRKTKKGPKNPDFRHKDTDEALWINPNDPPWIKKQLELHDSRMAERGLSANMSRRLSRVSMWEYDE